MSDRRVGKDRRTDRSIHIATRRASERRDFPRHEVALDFREPGGRQRSCVGDLSPEGAAFITTAPPAGDVVHLRFTLPCYDGPVFARAQVVSRAGKLKGAKIGVIFTDIDVDAELAIARWLHDVTAAR